MKKQGISRPSVPLSRFSPVAPCTLCPHPLYNALYVQTPASPPLVLRAKDRSAAWKQPELILECDLQTCQKLLTENVTLWPEMS